MAEQESPTKEEGRVGLDRDDESQDFVDQSKIDFDPDDGLYSGTAVTGDTEIPGPHLDESGELTGMDEARQQAEEAGIAPDDTEAAKSPVARAAEAENASSEGDGDASPEGDEQA